MSSFYVAFLAIGLPLIALELYGVARRPNGRAGGNDTISEMWWGLRNRYPALTVVMVLFLLWLLYHFTVEGWRRRRPQS
jgi:hypothetical protein